MPNGLTKVIIGDFTNFIWEYGRGIVYPRLGANGKFHTYATASHNLVGRDLRSCLTAAARVLALCRSALYAGAFGASFQGAGSHLGPSRYRCR